MTSARCALALGLLLSLLPVTASAERDERRFGEYVRNFWLDLQLDHRLREQRVKPLRSRDFSQHDPAQVELGRLLFFDKELSGNRDVSCATCHHPLAASADGLSLPVGVGGRGLATTRSIPSGRHRVPRNAPDVFNRGHRSFRNMFWDGRVSEDPSAPSGFQSPAGAELPPGLESALAVQAMFPVTSDAEMRGTPADGNELALAPGNTELWARIMDRLLAIEAYQELFAAAYPAVPEEALGFQHAANAIAAFEATAWRADQSPFDRYLRGDRGAMSAAAKRGALLFYGDAGCSSCHTGALQTDLDFHAVAMPQIGPGKGNGADGDEDFGRELVTGESDDRFRFRTPSLRNVALTGPWGHAGAYATLEGVVRHQLRPRRELRRYDPDQALLPPHPDDVEDFGVMESPSKLRAIARASELPGRRLSKAQVEELLAFLHSLTDPASLDLRDDVPWSVPSELPLAE